MDVCHLSAPCETPSSSNTVFGFVLEREACVVVLGIFTAPPAPRQLVFASRDFLQQKGNRCALMSTADYSRNIARKMRPRSSDGLSVKTTLVSVLPHELGGVSFLGGRGRTDGLAASCSAPQTETKSDLSTPAFGPRYRCPSLPKHRESTAYALSVLVQVELLSPRTYFEWLLDMIYTESRYKQQLSTCVMFAEAQVQRSVLYFRWNSM